jgi:DNA repair exonuclease SbcCD ATPase subunit
MNAKTRKTIATPEQFEGAVLMRVTEQNLKVVRYVDISIDRTLTLLGGDNGNGKTTILDGIDWAFGDKKTIQMDPIQHGKQEGFVTVEYGDGEQVTLKITKTFKRVGDKDFVAEVDIEIPGYLTPSRVQEFLNDLKGKQSLDPMWFDILEGMKQLLALRGLVDFDFDANKAEYDKLYKQRTDVNKDRDREQAAANSIDVTDKAPGEKVDEVGLTAELEAAGTKNLEIERRRSNREKAVAKVAELRAACEKRVADSDRLVADMYRQIEELKQRISAEQDARHADVTRMCAEADELQAKLDAAEPLPDIVDASAVTARLNEARRINRLIEDWETQRARKAAHQRKADAHAKESDELTAQLAELKREKEDAILKANLPIDGLGFADDHVTLHGVPWQQASEAQRIDASMAIAMAHNPRLRTILIRHGSGVGRKIRERIQQRAHERGYQVIMEVYDETGANSHIFVEDGLVKKIDGHEIPPQEMEPEPEVLSLSSPESGAANDSPDAPAAPRTRKRFVGPGAPTGGAA